MKQGFENKYVPLLKSEAAALTTFVNETVAKGILEKRNIFSPAELWNIHQRKKPVSKRRVVISSC